MSHRKQKITVPFDIACLLNRDVAEVDREALQAGFRRIEPGRGRRNAAGAMLLTFKWRRVVRGETYVQSMTLHPDGRSYDISRAVPYPTTTEEDSADA